MRPAANPDIEEVRLHRTRRDAGDPFHAARLACSSSPSGGLQAVAEEEEVSSGGGDESLPAAVHASATGETAVIWLGKTNQTGNATCQGELPPRGTIRGVDFRFRLYR
ncbi:MAG: hypothetical protein HUU06_12355 [Planctomycetaceae bacterium]|nr:hypothetical protein [Planctomycetota bacterium]NUN53560.1 hypothetical protein [Planctomycetaceae bacterium]